ncbi:MAG: PepSY domain-containing protein [Gammaproteobacteria bacterium]|uniref:PepSY domain-containing protein n=1 Tax=Rhodoferax sp. TaxID=50421 RepID=UPI0017DD2C78|nr:PepSY domain-containing protein [Rhodoferax sp.]MBU3900256.1 PepSY domain-containing protein [Gammaproteobacteria bacterium]MBA3057911.1 PepSY domain-containing protein [Rhodoferax sp.]MBU3997958.1 PepSY domain-containing protein [Gammaproteobacteria bacterium]MBU4079406.1 PepSY domain-containing protein [Gammaproteobacteria bacterium]MBU4111690.1 PepSY domain-containing protein [Gammaproteobacteria bacterium]
MKSISTLLCVLLLALGTPAWADVSRDQAAAVAQQASGARVLSVEKAEMDGRAVWRVKVLSAQGEVRVILIDAASGRVL